MPKHLTVDRTISDNIRAYLHQVSVVTGRSPNSSEEYGHGPVKWAAEDVLRWAHEQGYTFYNPRGINMTDKVMSHRITSYAAGKPVMKGNFNDAMWISQQMRKHYNSIGERYRDKLENDAAQVTYVYVPPEPPYKDLDMPVPSKSDISTNGFSTGAVKELAVVLRDFTNSRNDADVAAILQRTELELLRLLVDRL